MLAEHDAFIRQAYALAQQAVTKGNHPFGALLVHDGTVLLTAENTVNTGRDVTGHAERNLVSLATQQFSPEIMAHTILYTSTEPCAMCAGAIFWAGIPTVVFGCSVEALAAVTGGSLAIPCRQIFAQGKRPTEVIGPVLEAEGMRLHRAFWP